MLESLLNRYTRGFQRYMPTPLSIAVLLTLVAGALAMRGATPLEVMGAWVNGMWSAGLIRFGFQAMFMLVLGHVLAGIKAYNARALACAALPWTRVSRAHWDACQSANGAWSALTRRHFGTAALTLVPSDARANFFALCRRAQSDYMGLPFFMRYLVTDRHSLAEAMLEHLHKGEYTRGMPAGDWRVQGWRASMRVSAQHVLDLLAWHPHGKYAPYDLEGMLAYFRNRDDIGPPGTTEAYPFYNSWHKMGAFLYPALVTDWQSLEDDMPKCLSARKYLSSVHRMNEMLERFRADCA